MRKEVVYFVDRMVGYALQDVFQPAISEGYSISWVLGFIFLSPYLCKAQKDSSIQSKPYQIQSCKIIYQYSNGMQQGQKIVIIDKWGLLERQELIGYTGMDFRRSDSGISQNFFKRVDVLNLVTQDEVYLIDLNRKTGIRTARVFSSPVDTALTGKAVKKDTILDRECLVKEFENGVKIWLWKGIVLKRQSISQASSGIGEVAISIDENYVVKKEDFLVPQNVVLTEVH